MKPMFTPDQLKELTAKLSREPIKRRTQSGRAFDYLEGWFCTAEANRIFGFGNWSRETIELKCVAERPREIGTSKTPGFGVSYIAKVRVSVWGEGSSVVVREGTGAGHGIDRDLGQAHESAAKEAETDAAKRALITFGNPFGLALYDKEQENVESIFASHSDPAAPEPTAAPTNRTEQKGQDIKAENVEWARSFIEKAFQKETVPELREWERTCLTRLTLMKKVQPATSEWIEAKLEAAYKQLEPASGRLMQDAG